METLRTISKRPNEDEDTLQSTLPPAKRYASAQPFIKKPAPAVIKKTPGGRTATRSTSNGPVTPPQEPEIIDLSVEVVAKPIFRPGGDFPRFEDGDVCIELGSPGLKSTYQLHSNILARASPWFDQTMRQPIKEFDNRIAALHTKRVGVAVRYEMDYNSDLNALVLARTTLTKVKIPEILMPITPQKIASDNHHATSTDRSAKIQSDTNTAANKQTVIRHPNSNIATRMQFDIQHPTTNSAPTTLLPQTRQSTQAEFSTSETPALESLSTDAQGNDGKAPMIENTVKVKAEEPEIKKESEVSKPEEIVKAEEPDIKIEEDTSNSEVTQKNAIISKEDQVTMKESSATTEENQTAIQEDPPTGPSDELLSAYKNLFLIYYGRAPFINGKDINAALRQAEILIRVAELYGSIPVVRPYLGNCMMQFGRAVYTAILQDPPRWLQLSLYLESAPIFQESIIHIVGNFPHWPWTTVQLRDFPDDIKGPGGLFERKLNDLQNLQRDIDKILSMSSIRINGQEAQLIPENKKTYNTWLVVQFWRDWFTKSISKAGFSTSTRCSDGTIYRLMFKGGDAYLPLESVVADIKAVRELNRMLKGDKQEIEEDLKLMKDFAQKEVRLLCVNNSMLAVEEAGIEHLTCTNIDNNEIPWMNKDGI